MRGLSSPNFWRMRGFYVAYDQDENLAPLVREIAWSHNVIIMEKCKDSHERHFYIHKTKEFGWTKNVLIHQIENQSYQKTLLGQQNFAETLPSDVSNKAMLSLKGEYTFDFSLMDVGKSIGVATYSLAHSLPQNLRSFFPDKEEFIKRVEMVSDALGK